MNFGFGKSTAVKIGSLATVVNGMIFMPWVLAGTLRELHISLGGPLVIITGPVTSLTFNVRKNDVALFSGVDRPVIGNGQQSVSKTGLNIAGVLGDELYLDLNSGNGGRITGPVTLVAVIDDGINYTA